MQEQSKEFVWDRNHHSIFETFALDLQDFTTTYKTPPYGSQDVNYGLELQKMRHKEKNIHIKYEMTPRGHFRDHSPFQRHWSDERYTSCLECRSCRLTRTCLKDGKKVYSSSKNMLLYQVITNVIDGNNVANELYSCPGCGAISRIRTLQDGCPYCGACFQMNEFFPKVTNYYFIKDAGGTEQEVSRHIKKTIRPFIIVSALFLILHFYFASEESGRFFYSLISGTVGGIVFGSILGYLWSVIQLMSHLFAGAGKSIPMLVNVAGSGKNFVNQMKRYSPEFSYEYFSDKIVSILKMLIYSKNPQELPYYVGEPFGGLFSDILDSSYTGAVALKRFQVQEEYCYVTVDVYMDDIYDCESRIHEKRDTFRLFLKKNIRKPIDCNFSIERIQCKSCGSSFNAAIQRNCPNCGTRYEIEDDDWTVLNIIKMK